MTELEDWQVRGALRDAGMTVEYAMALLQRTGHGLLKYYRRGCRCFFCRAANAEQHREGVRCRTARGLSADDPRHGSATAYSNWGCRCTPCSEAHKAKCKANALRRRAAKTGAADA